MEKTKILNDHKIHKTISKLKRDNAMIDGIIGHNEECSIQPENIFYKYKVFYLLQNKS